MHPSSNVMKPPLPIKEPSGSISSPSAASSGYGSSAEDEYTISPYARISKQSPFDFSHDFVHHQKKSIDEFDTLCLLSESFLSDPRGNFALANQRTEPTLAEEFSDEVFEIKNSEKMIFHWQDDVANHLEPLSSISSSSLPPSSVDFFTEFFNDCSAGGAYNDSGKLSNTECVNSQLPSNFTSNLSASDYNLNRLDGDDNINYNNNNHRGHVSMLSDLTEIDEMFNFVLDTDDNLLPTPETCSRDKVFSPFESLQCNYEFCKSELPEEFHRIKYDDPVRLTTVLEEELINKDVNEMRNKRKRQSTYESSNPSKSQKQEFVYNDIDTSIIQMSNVDLKLQSVYHSIPLKKDLNEIDNLNYAQENANNNSIESQITKDTFLSNFTFQINDAENDGANDVASDDVKAFFNSPLDVGEIFSNLQFSDLQNDLTTEDVNEFVNSSLQINKNNHHQQQHQQQSNCSYFIIAVPTSLTNSNIASCIVVKPTTTTTTIPIPTTSKNPPHQESNSIKSETSQQVENRRTKSCQTAIKQELINKRSVEDRGNVLQTILTCGAINFNANQGSDVIYEGILKGQLTTTDPNSRTQSTMPEKHGHQSAAHSKSFKSDAVSCKGSNILHRLLKGQLLDKDVQRRSSNLPSSSSSSSLRHVAR